MTQAGVCPCEEFEHPASVVNPPGRPALLYRVGDFDSFRQALLLARPGEVELKHWRPSGGPAGSADLALQMVEWWAYLADILTFYNERLANEAYLSTATQPESVRALIRLLGYRPRPGIGASAVIAALSGSPKPFTLAAGFQVQSKPGPGKAPQIFELDLPAVVNSIDAVAADIPPDPKLLNGTAVLLKGTVSGIKQGDRLLLLPRNWTSNTTGQALASVLSVEQEADPRGRPNTRVTFTAAPGLSGALAADYRLLRTEQVTGVWTYLTGTTDVIEDDQADLASLVRQIQTNDPVVFERGSSSQAVRVTSLTEAVWYANPGNANDPSVSPDPNTQPPVPIPHTRITFAPDLTNASTLDGNRASVKVRFGWQDAGQLISWPKAAAALGPGTSPLIAAPGSVFPVTSQDVLVEGAAGDGARATGAVGASSARSIELTNIIEAASLASPLRVLFNLLEVSRGQSVTNEVLGNGDAGASGQEFVLKKSPLTYLPRPNPISGESYSSTLRVWVAGAEWTEVTSFYDQAPSARIFVTREDDEARTHVIFGDGVNGARLPSGVANVLASYRYGSGREAPESGALSVVLKPQPGLKALRNPLAASGGADPDPSEQIRAYAPRSVLTFGRAISGEDYEVIAAQAPGVARARSYWSWDPAQQRTLVTIYVGDDTGAVGAASGALAGAIDPNRPVKVLPATGVRVRLSLTLEVDSSMVTAEVVTAVIAALRDDDAGLLGAENVRIGKRVYDSEIFEACLRVEGALAVHGLAFIRGTASTPEAGPWHDPGQGCFFQLAEADLGVNAEATANVF